MFLTLAAVLFVLGGTISWKARKPNRSTNAAVGWALLTVGLVVITLAVLMVWGFVAYYSTPLKY